MKANKLNEYLEIRVGAAEKQAFRDAAELAGIPLSVWMRERMRRAAVRELEEGARPIAFLESMKPGNGGIPASQWVAKSDRDTEEPASRKRE